VATYAGTVTDSSRRERALAAIDDANAKDPNVVEVRGRSGPKELRHAELVTEWVCRMRPDADEALLLAARGHHFRRWTVPRNTYPVGRAGYLRWRKALHARQADELATLLGQCGYDDATIARVQSLVRKEGLDRSGAHDHNDDVQVLEDALCLVFLETQLADVAARLQPETLANVVAKTAHKMSGRAVALIDDVPLTPASRRILAEALARGVVTRYLDALAAHDWPALAATLAVDVHRVGPYGDVFDGRDAYARFLRQTIDALPGYELGVERLLVAGPSVAVELHETVDDGDGRLHTDEVVVFDTASGLIAGVAVYLRASVRLSGT
jgi:ketosteroid isomerase-like protein